MFLTRWHRNPTRPGKRSPGCRLGVESLDNRWCPSCTTAVIDGHVLQITGDNFDNDVQITDSRNGGVTTLCDGTAASFTGIDRIQVDTRAGVDSVWYRLAGDRVTGMAVQVDLGSASIDSARFDLSGMPNAPHVVSAPFAIDVQGGAGKDVVELYAYNLAFTPTGSLDVSADLGAGDDEFYSQGYFLGDGQFNLNADLGSGRDYFLGEYFIYPGSSVSIRADVLGGTGDDQLSLDFINAGSGSVQGLLDGGTGSDTGFGDTDVTVIHCENL